MMSLQYKNILPALLTLGITCFAVAAPQYSLDSLYLEDLFRIYARSPEPLQRGPFETAPSTYDPSAFGDPTVRELRRSIATKLSKKRDAGNLETLEWYLTFLDNMKAGDAGRRDQLRQQVRQRIESLSERENPEGTGSTATDARTPAESGMGIQRMWIFLFGPEFAQMRDDDQAVTEYLGKLRASGATDIVYSINRLGADEISRASEYDNYQANSVSFERTNRIVEVAASLGMDTHLMLFLPADNNFVREWAPAILRLTSELDIRSLLLDVEGGSSQRPWWIHQPTQRRRAAARAIDDQILAEWRRPELGLGVTSLAVGTRIGELMDLADYGLPQMYLSRSWGESPSTVQSNMSTSYRRYRSGDSESTRRVVIGLSARRDILAPQSPLQRTCIGLESALTLDRSESTVKEIAIWDSDKLLDPNNTDLRHLFGSVGRALSEHGHFGPASLHAVCR